MSLVSSWLSRIMMHHSGSDSFIPTKADYRYMTRLRKDRVMARLTHTPFDDPICPYTLSLIDYFVRASEPQTPSNGIIRGFSTTQEAELQCLVQQL